MAQDFRERFSGRADSYSRFRPGYPRQVLDILARETGFDKSHVVADIGSGTGLLARLFALNGNRVFGVEPNDAMRSFGERHLSGFPNFVSVKGRAEETTLADGSVDLITAGQALHWFDPEKTVREFSRISRANAHLCVVYNDKKPGDEFVQAYEAVVQAHNTDRASVPEVGDALLSRFFEEATYARFTVPNEQVLDHDGLLGRLASASYMPSPGDGERYERFKEDVSRIFLSHQTNGTVTLRYDTNLFVGRVRMGTEHR